MQTNKKAGAMHPGSVKNQRFSALEISMDDLDHPIFFRVRRYIQRASGGLKGVVLY